MSDDPFVENFLKICNVIRKTSLNAKTLTGAKPLPRSESIEALRREQQVEAWIDLKTIEYNELLYDPSTIDHVQPSSKNTLRKSIAEAALRVRLEHLFVRRVLQGKDAVQINHKPASNDIMAVQRFTGQKILMAQVERALQLKKGLCYLEEILLNKRREYRKLQEECRKGWTQQKINKHPSQEASQTSEAPLLQRVLIDLITGSGIEWYSDHQLRGFVFQQEG